MVSCCFIFSQLNGGFDGTLHKLWWGVGFIRASDSFMFYVRLNSINSGMYLKLRPVFMNKPFPPFVLRFRLSTLQVMKCSSSCTNLKFHWQTMRITHTWCHLLTDSLLRATSQWVTYLFNSYNPTTVFMINSAFSTQHFWVKLHTNFHLLFSNTEAAVFWFLRQNT